MKKYIGIIIGLLILCQAAFAVDTLRVIRAGKLIKTSSIDLTSVSAVTLTSNYDVTGNVSCNTLVVTTSATIPTLTVTTANITNLGATKLAGNIDMNGKSLTGIKTISGMTFASATVTAAATNVTANYSIPVTINGVAASILLRI